MDSKARSKGVRFVGLPDREVSPALATRSSPARRRRCRSSVEARIPDKALELSDQTPPGVRIASPWVLNLLKAAFRDDELTRTRRGRAGADIFHHVRYRDGGGGWAEAGLIIYECKDTLRWNNDFVVQAKRAAKTHEAAYTVLVSRAFPRGQKYLLVRGDGVIVVHPTLLLHVAHVVRRMVEEIHRAGLGADGRARKTEELFAYLKSERFKHSLGSIANATATLKEMLEAERDSHRRTWSRRENAYNEIREITSTVDEEIRVIVERPIRSRRAKVVPIAGAS